MRFRGFRLLKNRITVCFLSLSIVMPLGLAAFPMDTCAATTKTLTLSQAKSLAVANSESYENIESKISAKEASLSQAYRSIKEKKKNLSTFRWSPLINFKFPTKPDLSEAYGFEFKPIEIQSQIDTLKHQLTDIVLKEYETISSLYVDAVVLEDTIAYNQKQLDSLQEQLIKDKAKLKLGQASQADVDILTKNIESLTQKIAADSRSLEQKRGKISDKIGMDISTGYRLVNPLISAEISRNRLEELIQYTLDHDQSYYDACMAETTAKISLRTNYQLMKEQYGKKMDIISGYIEQAFAGTKVKKKPFKQDYEDFLKEIDKPWQGKLRILFIKIPKEWFKGAISGIRYVEDEPYALYEATLEYETARLEKEICKNEVTTAVKEAFENYVSMRNAYLAAVKSVKEAEKSLDASLRLNRLGEMTNEEYTSEREDYEDLMQSCFSALGDYSKALYSLDRTTCGGVTLLLRNQNVDLTIGEEGNSYVKAEYAGGAYYYITPIISEEQFRLYVAIPDDFEIDITHYELWCDGEKIGERTSIDQSIRHMMLSTEQVKSAFLRFYNNGKLVDDCEIDVSAQSGELKIVSAYSKTEEKNKKVLGDYKVTANGKIGTIRMELTLYQDEVAFYRILTKDGQYLTGERFYDVQKSFTYLELLQPNLGDLTILLYDEQQNKLNVAGFDTATGKIVEQQGE